MREHLPENVPAGGRLTTGWAEQVGAVVNRFGAFSPGPFQNGWSHGGFQGQGSPFLLQVMPVVVTNDNKSDAPFPSGESEDETNYPDAKLGYGGKLMWFDNRVSVGQWNQWDAYQDVKDATEYDIDATIHGTNIVLLKDDVLMCSFDIQRNKLVPIFIPTERIGKVFGQDIQAGSYGKVKLWYDEKYESGTVLNHVSMNWIHSGTKLSVGAKVIVRFFVGENIWRIVGASCAL